jgi:hypothetical protein
LLWLNSVPLYICATFSSPSHLLMCTWLLWVSATVNMAVQVSFPYTDFISFGYSQWWNSWVHSEFLRSLYTVFVMVTTYMLPTVHKAPFFHLLTRMCWFWEDLGGGAGTRERRALLSLVMHSPTRATFRCEGTPHCG